MKINKAIRTTFGINVMTTDEARNTITTEPFLSYEFNSSPYDRKNIIFFKMHNIKDAYGLMDNIIQTINDEKEIAQTDEEGKTSLFEMELMSDYRDYGLFSIGIKKI